jgi:SAM-dependent methyltransferase
VRIEAREHPMVQAAVARLAGGGAWARMRVGEPVEDRVDVIDIELLVAVGIIGRRTDGCYEVLDDELALIADNAAAVANGPIAYLRRALRHAEGGALGRGSGAVADLMRDRFLPLMTSSRAALESGSGRFLDVGTGVAAIASRLCTLYPGTTATGLDVSQVALDIAREELAAAELSDRVELRLQPVESLTERDAYDLAWLPQPFIPPGPFREGVYRVFDALRPDRWVLVPLATTAEDDADPFDRALFAHAAHLMGGGPVSVTGAVELLEGAGFVDIAPWFLAGQAILRARRP